MRGDRQTRERERVVFATNKALQKMKGHCCSVRSKGWRGSKKGERAGNGKIRGGGGVEGRRARTSCRAREGEKQNYFLNSAM